MHRLVLSRSSKKDIWIVRKLRQSRVPLLYGRPRSLLRLAELDRESTPRTGAIRPWAILTSGDNLHEDQRLRLESWFQCRVSNAYVSQEGGFVGVECPKRSGIHVLCSRAVVEVLQENGGVATEGPGELVITNLENVAMPFIRYRTGDSVVIERSACSCGYVGLSLTNVAGRESTYFTVAGQRINPSILNPIFERLPIKQFQVIQVRISEFQILWIPEPNPGTALAHISNDIASSVSVMLKGARIQVSMVKEIGTRGQKIQRYVNECDAKG